MKRSVLSKVENLYIGWHLRGETKLLFVIFPGLIRSYLVKGFCCFIKCIPESDDYLFWLGSREVVEQPESIAVSIICCGFK